jgi:hypothetical protein
MGEAADLAREHLRGAFVRTRTIVDGLTDDEYFWEPVRPCWSVRPHEDVEYGWGVGSFRCEDIWPAPHPLPIATIAWRLVHLAAWTDIYRSFAFEDGTESLLAMEVPGTADRAVAWLATAQDRFADAVAGLGSEEFDELRPAHWGEPVRLSRLVGVIAFEHTHHGAEISLLRDLHRGAAAKASWLLWPADPEP